MADEFDRQAAYERNENIVIRIQKIRDMMNKELIDYYYKRQPESRDQEEEYRQGMRKYLRFAIEDIDSLLDNDLR